MIEWVSCQLLKRPAVLLDPVDPEGKASCMCGNSSNGGVYLPNYEFSPNAPVKSCTCDTVLTCMHLFIFLS